MKLLVPHLGEFEPADAHLMRLAEFMGIECRAISLAQSVPDQANDLSSIVAGDDDCLVVHPAVIQQWLGEGASEVAPSMASRFRRILVHAVRPSPFDSELVEALTAGCFHSVCRAPQFSFHVAPESRAITEAFAGLSFGIADPANDCIFLRSTGAGGRKLITLGGEAFLAAVTRENAEIVLVGSKAVADLNMEIGTSQLTEWFSRFAPHAMALRHLFGEQCWRPAQPHAAVIVDDPLLRTRYGFLNFEQLLRLMERHNFSTTIAFIPHNFHRTSPKIARLFREHSNRLSLCFHGNDHTAAEFGCSEPPVLNSILLKAEQRMAAHRKITSLPCDHVMVFPQGKFSVQAMAALDFRNFDAAVNTVPHPHGQPVELTLRELLSPAVLRYGGFPLFVRRGSIAMQEIQIAFQLFFGSPLLIVEHHNIFEHPQSLIDAVMRINKAAPGIRWSSAGSAVRGSVLLRRDADGVLQVKAYARAVSIENQSPTLERVSVEWEHANQNIPVEALYHGGNERAAFERNRTTISIPTVLEAGSSDVFCLRHHRAQEHETASPMGLSYWTRAFFRRRLSEFRDNYVSRSPSLLAAARAVQRRLQP